MKILVLYPGKFPKSPEEINCFSDVWTYYLINELRRHTRIETRQIPALRDRELVEWFDTLDITGFDAVLAMGLRYFSTVSREIGQKLRKRLYPSLLCQIHDGSRLDSDPVDVTFTLKDDANRYPFDSTANRHVRHHSYNIYIGWAADPDFNIPQQDDRNLRILVDHTNYGPNPIDHTREILHDIKKFIDGRSWAQRWDSVIVRRFDSGQIIDVDFDRIDEIQRYDRTAIPFTEICQEHGAAHIFCVTHPESVGQVVLETAMAGALTVCPKGFIPADRLDTVRAIEYDGKIDWHLVLNNIDPAASRTKALDNSWMQVSKRIRDAIWIRQRIRRAENDND